MKVVAGIFKCSSSAEEKTFLKEPIKQGS